MLPLEHTASEKDSPSRPPGLRLIAQAQKRAVKNGKAFDLTLELTHRCNVACRHCYIIPGEEELPFPEWEGILQQLADHGVFVLTLTGGEPTLYSRFFDLLDVTARLGFAVRLFSNLTTLSEEDVDRLCGANILGVETTFHAADPEVHDRFCRSPGAFARTMRALALLKDRGLPAAIKTAWTRCNHEDPAAMFRLAADLGLPMRASPSVSPRRDMSTDHFTCKLSEGEVFELFMKLIQLSEDPAQYASCDTYPLPKGDYGFCGAGVTGVRVTPSGKVHPCVEMQQIVGDLRRQSFEEIWNDSPFLKKLRTLRLRDATECMNCPDLRFCFRCPGLAYNEGAGLCGPATEACLLARVNRRTLEALSESPVLETSETSE